MDYITDDAEAKTTFEWRKIDDLEIFGANSQSVIFCSLAAPNWESVRNAMLMCEKFSPFGNDYGLVGGVLFRRFLGANIAISCLG